MRNLQLKDIFIGKTDAKNELMEGSFKEKSSFLEGFLIPENIVEDDFFQGKRYFITGLKGTGKTALLRYLSLRVENEFQANTLFILFKTGIREEERKNLSNVAAVFSKGEDTLNIINDYERPWLWFFFQRIVEVCEQKGVRLFQNDSNWKSFLRSVSAAMELQKEKTSIFPKLTRGNIEISTKYLNAGVEFVPSSDSPAERKRVNFLNYVSECEELFSRLTPGKDSLYLFVDELELSLGDEKRYKRDIFLIRDLILVINRVNEIARKRGYKLFCITGIRKEVIAATESAGKEINKPISDFGITLRWQQSGGNAIGHPLIRIIKKRLMVAEQALPMIDRASEAQVFEKYFPEQISQKSIQSYILDRTWYRPRDIVRLLGIAQQQFPNERMFTQSILDSINKDFSVESWTEQVEELRTRYTNEEIEGIKHILMSLKCPFVIGDIQARANSLRSVYGSVDALLRKYKMGEVLNHLYALGVVGNWGKKMRFAFRGDDGLLIENSMTVHPALWNVLSIIKARPRSAK